VRKILLGLRAKKSEGRKAREWNPWVVPGGGLARRIPARYIIGGVKSRNRGRTWEKEIMERRETVQHQEKNHSVEGQTWGESWWRKSGWWERQH